MISTNKIKINKNRILACNIDASNYMPSISISEYYYEDLNIKKSFSLNKWDDYGLNADMDGASIEEIEGLKKISFEFDITHPLYIPLLHLCQGDLIIETDDTRDHNKYLRIYKKDNKVYMDFVNEIENADILDKFDIFIKNVLYDGRSKIDQEGKDTKDRLLFFFKEASEAIINKYHQMTLEEYMLQKQGYIDDEEVLKYTKKFPKRN